MFERLKVRRAEEGFTLIELLIVVIILAVLATIVVFAVGTTSKNAAIAACKTTVKTVLTAIEAYDATKGHFPAATTTLTSKTATTGSQWLRAWPSSKQYHITYSSGGATAFTLKVTGTTATVTTACTSA